MALRHGVALLVILSVTRLHAAYFITKSLHVYITLAMNNFHFSAACK
jgi:hypothetical protein